MPMHDQIQHSNWRAVPAYSDGILRQAGFSPWLDGAPMQFDVAKAVRGFPPGPDA